MPFEKTLQRMRGALARRPAFQVTRLDDAAAWKALMDREGPEAWRLEEQLVAAHPEGEFTVPGHCWVDNTPVEFQMDYLYAFDYSGKPFPNWRERMTCPRCAMNNRHRAMVHLAAEFLGLTAQSRIYLTEQLSPIYVAMSARYPRLVGSEFLGPDVERGIVNASGIRHEDVTRLTFPDASLDAVLTFDVLEHVPDYRKALAECARVLAPGGVLLLSVPFMENAHETRVRASLTADGRIEHHHAPAYHGDPVRPGEGVLCFQEFGWDLLDSLRDAGFTDAAAIAYRNAQFGYLGGWPMVFVARTTPH